MREYERDLELCAKLFDICSMWETVGEYSGGVIAVRAVRETVLVQYV